MQNLKSLIKKFFNISYIKFGLIVTASYIVELFIYSLLLKLYSIFYSNIIASFIGVSLDFFISTSKKSNLFNYEKSKKFKFYIMYLIYITLLIIFVSWVITFINIYLDRPIISKLSVIPISFTLNYYFFILTQKKLN